MRILLTLLLFVSAPSFAALNDTGQDQCDDGTNTLVACTPGNTGDAATHPRQDGRFGRDAQAAAGQLTKTGGGAAGFDFTPLDAAGNPIALTNGMPSSTPASVLDNVTGPHWEVKPDDGGLRDTDWTYSWYDGSTGTADGGDNCFNANRCDTDKYAEDVNTPPGLCGYDNWRLPTRRELLSIVHRGTSAPAIDVNFFPNSVGTSYWSIDDYHPDTLYAWLVHFDNGYTTTLLKSDPYAVRLVTAVH
jgi:hypothetical protein